MPTATAPTIPTANAALAPGVRLLPFTQRSSPPHSCALATAPGHRATQATSSSSSWSLQAWKHCKSALGSRVGEYGINARLYIHDRHIINRRKIAAADLMVRTPYAFSVLLELDRPVAEQADALGVEVEEEQTDDADQHPRPQVLAVLDGLVVLGLPDLRGLCLIVTAGDLRRVAQRFRIGGRAQVLERVGQSDGTEGLGDGLAVTRVHGLEEVAAVLLDPEVRGVAAGRGLVHADLLGDLVGRRIDHLELGVELVDELVARVDGVDGHHRAAVGDLRGQVVAVVDLAAHRRAHDLRPELRIAAPADPVDAPAVLDVGGPRDRVAGAMAPAREDRFAEVGDQDHLGGR